MNSKNLILTIAASLAWGGFAFAQEGEDKKPDRPKPPAGERPGPPEGGEKGKGKGKGKGQRPGQPGQGGGGGIAEALKKLDTDGDGKITKEEAGDRWERMARMDKNEDGAIGSDEIPQGRPGGGTGGRPGQGGGGGRGMSAEMIDQIFERADANGDGKITADEAGERWERLVAADGNEDDGVDKEEFGKMIKERMAAAGGGGTPGGGRPGGGQMFDRADTNKDGKITKEEAGEQRWNFIGRLDKNEDGAVTKEEAAQFGGGRPGEGGKGGPGKGGEGGKGKGGQGGGPTGMFDRFDKDGDGKLSKEEVPEEMWANLSRADDDADGRISQEELQKVFSQRQGAGGGDKGKGKGKGKGNPDGGPGRPEGEKPGKDEA